MARNWPTNGARPLQWSPPTFGGHATLAQALYLFDTGPQWSRQVLAGARHG
jgi:hypothetical protein